MDIMGFDLAEAIGFVAGTIISVSALPQIFGCLKDPEKARAQSVVRNGMISVGNVLWVVYGLLVQSTSMTTMSVIALVLNAIILFLAVRARFKANGRGGRSGHTA